MRSRLLTDYLGHVLACFFACVLCVCNAAETQPVAKFPSRAVRFVVPYPAGGPVDFTARAIAPRMAESLGVPVVIDNRPGASTILGTELVARAGSDGHTFLMVTSTIAINPSVTQKLPYDTVRDLSPVTIVIATPFSLVVHPALPVRRVSDLVKLAQAKPGVLMYPSSGVGSANHLAIVLFSMVSKMKATHIPYKGTAQGMADLLAGHVQFSMSNPIATLPHARSGRVRLLAFTSRQRLMVAPEVPTVAESGWPSYEAGNWHALFAPAGIAKEYLKRIHAEVVLALAVPENRQRFLDSGAEIGGASPEDFSAYFKNELNKWSKAVQAAQIRPEGITNL